MSNDTIAVLRIPIDNEDHSLCGKDCPFVKIEWNRYDYPKLSKCTLFKTQIQPVDSDYSTFKEDFKFKRCDKCVNNCY